MDDPNDLRARLDSTRSPSERIELHYRLCRTLAESDPSGALLHGRHALRLMNQHHDQHLRLDILIATSRCRLEMGDIPGAEREVAEALALLHGLPEESRHGIAFSLAGVIHLRKGELESARSRFEKALLLFSKKDDAREMALAHNRLGLIAHAEGDFPSALVELRMALDRLGGSEDARLRATILTSMAAIHQRAGRVSDALRKYRGALDLRRRLNDPDGTATTLSCIAELLATTGNTAEAAAAVEEALELRRELGDDARVRLLTGRLGLLLAELGDDANGARHLRAALPDAEDTVNATERLRLLTALARLELRASRPGDARAICLDALRVAEKLDLRRERMAMLELLVACGEMGSDAETDLHRNMVATARAEMAESDARRERTRAGLDAEIDEIERNWDALQAALLRLEERTEAARDRLAAIIAEAGDPDVMLLRLRRELGELLSHDPDADAGLGARLNEVYDRARRHGEERMLRTLGASIPNDVLERPIEGAPRLSRPELRVVTLLRAGFRQHQIAALLGMKPRTVETHRRNINFRLGRR